MKNWQLAGIRIAAARHADDAALERHLREFGLQVRIFRLAAAVAAIAVAGLRHEARDHAMERHVVVEAVARELLDAGGVSGREVVAQPDHHIALGGFEHQRVLRIGLGGAEHGGAQETSAARTCENADHESSRKADYLNLALSRAATLAGTKCEMSPPILAIWRTSVAVIGRTGGRRRQEHRLHLRHHRPVHAGHLHLVIEVGAVAQSPDQDGRAFALRRRHHQIVEGEIADLAAGLARHRLAALGQHVEPLLRRENRGLAGMDADGQHQAVANFGRLPDDIEMTVGDGVERPGIQGNARHSARLARQRPARKAAFQGRESVQQPLTRFFDRPAGRTKRPLRAS